jgi:GT2 family glycosyltransferase
MELSIIIVNYKTPELIIQCLDSVKQHTSGISYEILIVNNASKAHDEALVKAQHPDVQWIEMGYNAGFGRANNRGMRAAKGQYLLLLNSDTTAIDNSIGHCWERLRQRPEVIAAGAHQLFPDRRPRPFYHSFSFRRTFWIVPPHPFFHRLVEKCIPSTQYTDVEEVDYIAAAFLMLRKNAFEQTQGFDEELFLYGEDVEWSYRLAKLGKLLIFNDCQFIHDEWGSKPERYQELRQYTYFNRFDPQIQLSNLVWIRKQYGMFSFFLIMLHYWLWIPVFFSMKFFHNLLKGKNIFSDLNSQRRFARTIGIFSRYFWKILLKKPTFYQLPASIKF